MEMEHLSLCMVCGSKTIAPLAKATFLYKCSTCGYIFDNPRPTQAEITNYYSMPSKYDQWLVDIDARDILWKRRLAIMKKYGKKGGSLLDVSTGIGQFLNVAASYYSTVEGTEISNSAISIAKQKYNLTIKNGTIGDSLYKEKQFDVVTLFHVLEHVSNPREELEYCHALLDNDGLIVVAVPNDVMNIKTKVKYLLTSLGIKKFPNYNSVMLPTIKLDGTVDEIHLSHFTPKSLSYLFKEVGFTVIDLGLDPHYVAEGTALVRKNIYFKLMSLINYIFGINMYETIWIVGRKA